jgi:cell division septal protein FtsQ
MRLRRRRTELSRGRRQRRAADQTGSPSKGSPAFLYRSRRSGEELNTGRQLARETADKAPRSLKRFLLHRFGLIILLIALAVSCVSVLSLSSDARVVSLTPAGSAGPFMHDEHVYQAAADSLLAGSVWNRNKITVNTEDISRQMLKRFPELSSVSVTLPLLSKHPTVYVQTARPALILSARNGSYLIDSTGKALINAASLSDKARQALPLVTDQSGLDAHINHQVLSSGDVDFILTVIAQLAAGHVSVSALVLPAGTSELDLHVAGQPYTVKFNLQSGDARQQAGTFLATQAELKSRNITPSQYVDVRVDGRAYYK